MKKLLCLLLVLLCALGCAMAEDKPEVFTAGDYKYIVLADGTAEQDKVLGLELGAEDYVTKPFGVRELQTRVATVLRRLPPKSEALRVGALTLMPQQRSVRVDGTPIDLTAREFELLLYLARRAGETVTRGQLLKDVWGYASEDDPSRTVDSHIKTLRIKLGDTAGEPRFIRTIRGTGYRLLTGDEA